jgi:subfamily B ATP-binding cassette protein MsbA
MIAFLFKVWGLAQPYRARLLLGVVTGIIGGFMEPLMILTITLVYAVVFNSPEAVAKLTQAAPDSLRAWLTTARESLAQGVGMHPAASVVLVSAIPAVILLRGLFSYLNVYFLQWTAIRAITDLRVRLFEHLLGLSAGFFNRASSGELMSRLMNDTHTLQGIISGATAVIVKDPVTLVATLGGLLWFYPKLTLISLIVLPVCMAPIAIYGRKVRRASKAMQTHAAELTTVMSEAFTGTRIIKAYNLEATMAGQFRTTARHFISHYMRIIRSMEIPGPLLEFMGAIGVALVFLYLLFGSGARPDSASLLAVVGSIWTLYRPLKNLTRLHNQLEQARAASERVFELLQTESTEPEPAQPKPLRALGADIHFDQVDFAYGDRTVLSRIDLKIQAGQLVALVGASGSGKTTLANLLLRFYDPKRGAVRIGGLDLREVRSRDLRSQIAVVTQETILFNDTIRNNIALGRPGATEEQILAAARHAHAHDFILEKPGGYDAVVGEKGVNLSGGQRQRIAIARAMLKDAPILLLDEATSALDTESERAVQAALDDLMQGRTCLCIAHRLSTILHADVIIVLDQGRIVEMGRHDELLQRGGVYRRLYELQFQG